MKACIITIFSFLIIINANGSNNDYNKYCKELKDKLNVYFSISEESVVFQTDTDFLFFQFGNKLPDFPTLPSFIGGPIVKFSEDCHILMMDIKNMQKPRPESYPKNRKQKTPVVRGWMLNNCGIPWSEWYINNTGGVILDEKAKKDVQNSWDYPLPEDKLLALQKKKSLLTKQYEIVMEEGELTNKTNCDIISIVRIPNMKTITSNSENVDSILKKNATECYGVEFYKKSSYEPLLMLFFINGNNATIDECVAKIADYVKFE